MRWAASMERIADAHARRAMNGPTPPYIYISQQCEDVDQCFTPLSDIAHRVSEVQEELHTRKEIEVTHVITTSDERDLEWWSDVGALGWTWVDYAAGRTEEIYGNVVAAASRHLVFLDAIIQSNAAGLVGTRGYTMSTVVSRRVQSCYDGATRLIRWGWPGADDQ
ncbi:hypothetical protein BDR06DRAFT_972487 [Suillus hirtellus]|nr:hypothetical protein BDR06DRAFT_972487 [Suillus hirtellus]